MATKWDLLQADIEAAEKAVQNLRAEEEWLLSTPLADPGGWGPMKCRTCHTELPTEAAFAQHYTVPDARFRNLGHCPTKDKLTLGQALSQYSHWTASELTEYIKQHPQASEVESMKKEIIRRQSAVQPSVNTD